MAESSEKAELSERVVRISAKRQPLRNFERPAAIVGTRVIGWFDSWYLTFRLGAGKMPLNFGFSAPAGRDYLLQAGQRR